MHIERTTKSLAKLTVAAVMLSLALAGNLGHGIVSYLGFSGYLENLRSDSLPLGEDALIGPWLEGALGSASVRHMFAAIGAFGLLVALLIVAHTLGDLADDSVRFLRDKRMDVDRDHFYSFLPAMLRRVGRLVGFGATAAILVYFEVEGWRLRGLVGAMYDSAGDVPLEQLKVWGEQLKDHKTGWFWSLTDVGALAYVAVAVTLAGSLPLAIRNLSDAWSATVRPLDKYLGASRARREQTAADGPGSNNRPAAGPAQVEEAPSNSPEPSGGPVVLRRRASRCSEPIPVIGAQPPTSVTIEHARKSPALYHVDELEKQIYDAAWWRRHQGAKASDSNRSGS